ncbi:MAG: sodium-dependent transporter [Kiritimatiellae bacterium]|nr:sodium-dependent transporter [Kiritimatiellia bacterium]
MNDAPTKPKRETWNTRSAFVLAAIGSAVGLGNLWGFPYKLYTYGGGAFLIPYFTAMLIMGIPLLVMEFSLGHWAQQGPPGSFAKVMKKYSFVGWWLVALAFVIITYYAVILAYCIDYLVISIMSFGKDALPWAGENPSMAKAYFLDGMVGVDGGSMALGAPAGKIVAGTLAAWALIYLCLFRGVKWVSKIVLITVPLPWIMLVILTIRGLTLDGALQGLEFYLEPRWSKLLEPDTWRFAFGQVFFSMSLGFAVMLSYASFLHRKSDINNNALMIGLGDIGTSFIGGIAVFSMLGGMAHAATVATGSAVSVTDLVPGDSTVGLSFIVFPYGLTQLPAGAFFSCVFFLALLTLGIDSAFSIVEACLTTVCDSKPKWPRKYVLPGICIVGAATGMIFTATRGGINWLGLTDGLINGPFGILIVALAECLVIGWAWRGDFVKTMRQHANERSDWKLYAWWDVIVRFVAPALLSVLIVWSISGMVHDEYDKYKASKTEDSIKLQAVWPQYEPLKKAVEKASSALVIGNAHVFQAKQGDDNNAIIEAKAKAAVIAEQLATTELAAAPKAAEIAVINKAAKEGARPTPSLKYNLPLPMLVGSTIFVIIPFLCWFLSAARRSGKKTADKGKIGGRNGIIYSAVIMVISAIVIETAQAKDWLHHQKVDFTADGDLNTTAYIFLAVGLFVIFGGLAWCFWKAMLAAGRPDPEIKERDEN